MYIPADDYLPEAQRLCRKHGALFVCDEVQTGMGRTGRFLCCEHWALQPDIVTLSKSLSGGYIPVSATITRRKIHDATFSRLERCQVHSTTFGQNELAMAAGLASIAAVTLKFSLDYNVLIQVKNDRATAPVRAKGGDDVVVLRIRMNVRIIDRNLLRVTGPAI